MSSVTFFSAKGGQGCSTVAAATAVVLSRSGRTLLVDHGGDLPTVLGILGDVAEPGPITVSRSLELIGPDGFYTTESPFFHGAGFDHVVIDIGLDHDSIGGFAPDQLLLVTTQCYIALRRAMNLHHRPDGIVMLRQADRALDETDVANVVGSHVLATIDQDAAVARAIDAGILTSRIPRTLERALRSITGQEVPTC